MRIFGDFFGFGGFWKEPEGAWSWQHILFTSIMVSTAIFLAIFLGLKKRYKYEGEKKIPIVVSAIAIDVVEIFKIIIFCCRSNNIPNTLLDVLPLYLCSMMLIALPLAAFGKGKLREAALDFVLIFGFIAGALGTVGAAQNYAAYPVLAFDNIVSAITHCISCFASLYIGITCMARLRLRNMPITLCMLFAFALFAHITNQFSGTTNYMFLERHDGTPYSIFWDMVGGNKVLYSIVVILIFVLLIVGFYAYKLICYLATKKPGVFLEKIPHIYYEELLTRSTRRLERNGKYFISHNHYLLANECYAILLCRKETSEY